MNSNTDDNISYAWEAVIRELVAKGEVPKDVLSDSDTIIKWWRSLNETTREEINAQVRNLVQSEFSNQSINDSSKLTPRGVMIDQVSKKRISGKFGCIGLIAILIILCIIIPNAFMIFDNDDTTYPVETKPSPSQTTAVDKTTTENPRYVYEDGFICIGADGEPIELINNPNATDPTYAELITFLQEDTTDSNVYKEGVELGGRDILGYVCADYAEDVHNNAEAQRIKAAWVSIDFVGEEEGHAINAFQTTDNGLVYIDCTGNTLAEKITFQLEEPFSQLPNRVITSWDNIAYVEIGKEYGTIGIEYAHSTSYSFYNNYKEKWAQLNRLIDEYNHTYAEASSELELWSASLDEKRKLVDIAYNEKEYDEYLQVLDDFNNEIEEYNNYLKTFEIEFIQKEEVISCLDNELGDFICIPLGIVEDIYVHWGN
ncbi:hypothetical protein ACFLTT_00185 [Chloroflexota bacterium]